MGIVCPLGGGHGSAWVISVLKIQQHDTPPTHTHTTVFRKTHFKFLVIALCTLSRDLDLGGIPSSLWCTDFVLHNLCFWLCSAKSHIKISLDNTSMCMCVMIRPASVFHTPVWTLHISLATTAMCRICVSCQISHDFIIVSLLQPPHTWDKISTFMWYRTSDIRWTPLGSPDKPIFSCKGLIETEGEGGCSLNKTVFLYFFTIDLNCQHLLLGPLAAERNEYNDNLSSRRFKVGGWGGTAIPFVGIMTKKTPHSYKSAWLK